MVLRAELDKKRELLATEVMEKLKMQGRLLGQCFPSIQVVERAHKLAAHFSHGEWGGSRGDHETIVYFANQFRVVNYRDLDQVVWLGDPKLLEGNVSPDVFLAANGELANRPAWIDEVEDPAQEYYPNNERHLIEFGPSFILDDEEIELARQAWGNWSERVNTYFEQHHLD